MKKTTIGIFLMLCVFLMQIAQYIDVYTAVVGIFLSCLVFLYGWKTEKKQEQSTTVQEDPMLTHTLRTLDGLLEKLPDDVLNGFANSQEFEAFTTVMQKYAPEIKDENEGLEPLKEGEVDGTI